MSNQTTRRNVITGAAALPLLPASALAAPVTLPMLPLSAYADESEIDKMLSSFRRDFDGLTPQHQKTITWLYRGLVNMTRDYRLDPDHKGVAS